MPDPAYQPSAASRKRDLTGTQVGRFIIHDRLGSGGMGEVYRAEDTKLRRTVAIKRLSSLAGSTEGEISRLLREGQRASALNHPNIASVYDVIEENGEVLLVMEYVQGETLRERLTGPMKPEQFLPIAVECASALAAAHEKGILHSDIKPENIMLTPDGHVKLLDFGVARRVATSSDPTMSMQNLSVQGAVGGTPAYMAPEILLGGEPDLRADVFSLGLVFHEMLSGKHPFRDPVSTTPPALRMIQQATPPPLPKSDSRVMGRIGEVITKCLQRDFMVRYPDAKPLYQDVLSIAEGTRPKFAAIAAPSRRGRKIPVFVLPAVAVVLALAILITPLRARLSAMLGRGATSASNQIAQANLALLPVTVTGEDAKLKAFADGLAANLTSKLSQLSENHTIEVVSSNQVRDKKVTSPQQAFQQFGANLSVQMNVQQAGDLVRASYMMVDGKSGKTLAGDTITAPASDPFSLQDRVAAGVINALNIRMRPEEQTAIATHGTAIPAAYQYYLMARGYLQDFSAHPEHIDNALQVLDEALKLDPAFGLALAVRGEAYRAKYTVTKDKKWIERASTECNQAIETSNAGADGHICMGIVETVRGQYDKAVTELQRAIELDAGNEQAYLRLGRAYALLNRTDDAERTYQSLLKLHPLYVEGTNMYGAFYLQQARYADAAQMFSRVTILAPENPEGYYNLGAAYLFMGEDAKAVDALQKSIKLRPSAFGYSNLGTAYFRLRRFKDAAENYRKAINLDPKNHDYWANLGEAFHFSGEKDEASHAYRNALQLATAELQVSPNDASLQGDLASLYASLGDKMPAEDHLRRSLELGSGDKDLLYNAAVVYMDLGEPAVALEWLNKAVHSGYSKSRIQLAPVFDPLHGDSRFENLFRQPSTGSGR